MKRNIDEIEVEDKENIKKQRVEFKKLKIAVTIIVTIYKILIFFSLSSTLIK